MKKHDFNNCEQIEPDVHVEDKTPEQLENIRVAQEYYDYAYNILSRYLYVTPEVAMEYRRREEAFRELYVLIDFDYKFFSEMNDILLDHHRPLWVDHILKSKLALIIESTDHHAVKHCIGVRRMKFGS